MAGGGGAYEAWRLLPSLTAKAAAATIWRRLAGEKPWP